MLVLLLPCATLTAVGAADIVKFGGGVTVKATVVVSINAPDVPVIVTVVGPPVVAELFAVNVRVLVLVVLVGLNDAVTPLGRVEVTAKPTLPVKPPVGFTVIVLVLLPPWATLKVDGFADSVKPGVLLVLPDRVSAKTKAPSPLAVPPVYFNATLSTVRVESSAYV